jgi:hypothetical protein
MCFTGPVKIGAMTLTKRNGSGSLESAMVLLITNQTLFVNQMLALNGKLDERFARIDERFARIDERFARIEKELDVIKAILIKHEAILEKLPEAIRDKIGFKSS